MRGPTNFRALFPMLLLILALLPLIQPAPLLLRDESLLTANWKNLMSSTGLEAGSVARLASSNVGSETKKWKHDETGSEAARLCTVSRGAAEVPPDCRDAEKC